MMLGRLWESITEINRRIPGKSEKYVEDHRRIFKAIKERDASQAGIAMYNHLDGGMQDLLDDWENKANTVEKQ